MLWPLLLMALGFTTYYVWVLLLRMRAGLVAAKIRAAQRMRAADEANP
jgi:hypothetical protein